MIAKNIIAIVLAIIFYFALAYPTMQKANELTTQRDFFKFKKFNWAVYVANAIPIITITLRVINRKMSALYLHRAAVVYTLKAIVQFVTVVPAPNGTSDCIDRTFFGMIFIGNCADMMFSGHTAITYIMAPEERKWLFVVPVAVTLVLGEMHYTSDVLIAVIVSSWITFIIKPQEKQHKTPQERQSKGLQYLKV